MEPINSYTTIFNANNLAHTFVRGQHVIKDEQCNVDFIGGVGKNNDV